MYNLKLQDFDALGDALPRPKGYKILVAVAEMDEKKGSFYIPDQYRVLENTASILGYVVEVGDTAYKDAKRFSSEWCKPGDWVVFKSYSGTRFKLEGKEFRFINDDQVEATVGDPSKIERFI